MAPALDVLSFVNHAHRSLDLPSWVPEWRYAGDGFCALSMIMLPQKWVKVGEASYTVIHGQKISVRGRILDQVRSLTEAPPLPGPNDVASKTPADFQPQAQEWHDTVASIVLNLESYPSGLDLEEALWRTMCFNGGETAEPAPAIYGQAYESWKKVQPGMARLLAGNDDPLKMYQLISSLEHDLETAKLIDIMVSRYQANRCFCVTEKGYIGWANLAAKEGDLIVAFWGTRLLFTLRPTEGGYRLTGDCYLQGLMEGEGLRMDDITDENIVIV